LGYAQRMLGRRELAEEVCVDVFTRILEGAWRPTGRFRPFLFTLVHRACIDRLRRQTSWRRAWRRWLPDQASDDPGETLEAVDRAQAVQQAMAALPEKHRAVLSLYYGQELPSREVAQVLGCTDQQVRSQLAYARRLLREHLEDE
jgi:RNA polymerase sigma-70 factor (ECF subfamily)